MSDAGMDVGKIISLIMENPGIVEQIASLANSAKEVPAEDYETSAKQPEQIEAEDTPTQQVAEETSIPIPAPTHVPTAREDRRKNLIGALKPYLSPERARAADSILGVASILEIMRR